MENIFGGLFETTPEHPFYVLGQWVDAEDLEVGMPLSTYEGTDLVHSGTVTSVERIEQTQTMYNLTVDTAHTFFVGEGEWLVHNTNSLCYTFSKARLDHSFDRHAHEWFGMTRPLGEDAASFRANYYDKWTELVERGARSNNIVDWNLVDDPTKLHLAHIDGKYFAVQFFADGPRAGELATAFIPNSDQLRRIQNELGRNWQ